MRAKGGESINYRKERASAMRATSGNIQVNDFIFVSLQSNAKNSCNHAFHRIRKIRLPTTSTQYASPHVTVQLYQHESQHPYSIDSVESAYNQYKVGRLVIPTYINIGSEGYPCDPFKTVCVLSCVFFYSSQWVRAGRISSEFKIHN